MSNVFIYVVNHNISVLLWASKLFHVCMLLKNLYNSMAELVSNLTHILTTVSINIFLYRAHLKSIHYDFLNHYHIMLWYVIFESVLSVNELQKVGCFGNSGRKIVWQIKLMVFDVWKLMKITLFLFFLFFIFLILIAYNLLLGLHFIDNIVHLTMDTC